MILGGKNITCNPRLMLIFIVKYAILVTCINACIMNKNSITCNIEKINNYYNSEFLMNGFEHVFERINNELIKEYKMNLKESGKDLTYINNVSVDDRINNYILNNGNKLIRGTDIKHDIYTILKNYKERKNSRLIHSEPLNNDIINSGLVNLLLIPNQFI